jgi:hypothetical protein
MDGHVTGQFLENKDWKKGKGLISAFTASAFTKPKTSQHISTVRLETRTASGSHSLAVCPCLWWFCVLGIQFQVTRESRHGKVCETWALVDVSCPKVRDAALSEPFKSMGLIPIIR